MQSKSPNLYMAHSAFQMAPLRLWQHHLLFTPLLALLRSHCPPHGSSCCLGSTIFILGLASHCLVCPDFTCPRYVLTPSAHSGLCPASRWGCFLATVFPITTPTPPQTLCFPISWIIFHSKSHRCLITNIVYCSLSVSPSPLTCPLHEGRDFSYYFIHSESPVPRPVPGS